MSNTQQEVLIYKDNMLTTAQHQFEKDLKKRQREGWRLISVTPTNKVLGRISQLTAIYERDNQNNNTPLNKPASPNLHEQTQPQATEVLLSPSNSSEQTQTQVTEVPASLSNSSEETTSSTVASAYSKTIFLGFITATVISIMLISLGGDATTNHFLVFISDVGASLFIGVLISMLIIDWKGFVSLEGLVEWKQMESKKRNRMGCLFFFFFPIVFCIYLVRAGLKVFQSEGPVFSKEWNAPQPIKRRAKIGLVTGTIITLISLAFATGTYAAGTNVDNASTDITPTATTAKITNVSNSATSPATRPTLPPTPAHSLTATPTPPAKPSPTAVTYAQFDDGTYAVGTDIQPGTYRTREASPGCYYARLSGFSGTTDDIIANNNTDAPAIITISSTDKGFQSSNCGTWTKDLSAITTSKTSFNDGMYIVGTDIQPGTYKSSGQTNCYYARLSGFSGTNDDIIANNNTDTPAIVAISSTDEGFQSANCGTWTKE